MQPTTEPLWMAMLRRSRICCSECERLLTGKDDLGKSRFRPAGSGWLLAGRESVLLWCPTLGCPLPRLCRPLNV